MTITVSKEKHPPGHSRAPGSIYVVIVPRTRVLKHWRGYRDYDRARAVANNLGGVVSTVHWLRYRFKLIRSRLARRAA